LSVNSFIKHLVERLRNGSVDKPLLEPLEIGLLENLRAGDFRYDDSFELHADVNVVVIVNVVVGVDSDGDGNDSRCR
jgi:hypothetical protein